MDKQKLLDTIRKIKAKKTVGSGAWRFTKRIALAALIGGIIDLDVDLPDIDAETIAALGEDTVAGLLDMSWEELDELEKTIEANPA